MTKRDRAKTGSVYGTLELLILKILEDCGPMHGLDIARRIESESGDFLHIEEGALYPALQRLRKQELVEGEWRISAKRRRARFYDITPAGRKSLRSDVKDWARHTKVVGKVLGAPGMEGR